MYYNVLNWNGFFRDADAGQHIFNVNETGCLTHSNKWWLFFKNSPRAVFFFTPTCEKSMHTVLVCESASCKYLLPLIVYKSLNWYGTWCQNGQERAGYSNSLMLVFSFLWRDIGRRFYWDYSASQECKVRRKIPSSLARNYRGDVSHQITLLIHSPNLGIWSFNRSLVECVTEVEV